MTLPRASWLRLTGVGALGALLIVLVSAFFLLYLRVPRGHSPLVGYAPEIGALFLEAFPYPNVRLGPEGFRRAAIGLVLGMWAVYGGAVVWITRIQEGRDRRLLLGVITAVTVVAHLVLVVLPPVLSSDLYFYGIFGKMILAGGNPYLLPADSLSTDPLLPFASWTHLRSHYGPTFQWVATGAAWLGGGQPRGTALAFKAVFAAFNLLTCWVVWALARLEGNDDGLTPLALYGLNPLILTEGPGQAHSEAVMIPLALLGLLLWWQGRPLTGFVALLASAAVKYITGVLALLVAVKMVAEAGPGRRLATAGRLLGVSVLVAIGLYAPFWSDGAVFDAAADLVMLGSSLDKTRLAEPPNTPVVGLILFAIALAAAVPMAARLARPYLLDLTAVLVSLFVLLVLHWKMPWYFVTAMALTIAGGPTASNRPLRLLALLLGLLAMFLYCALVPSGSP